jgi:uncharacterized Tic20 family protein
MSTDNPQDKQLGMIAHLLGILTGFLGALVVWLIKKEQGGFVVEEAKKALNFQITLLIAFTAVVIVGTILSMLLPILALLFMLVYLALWVGNIVFSIKAGLAANKGEAGSYPYSLNLIK